MGFFDGLRRMIQGKPIFTDESKAETRDDFNDDDPWGQDDVPADEQVVPKKSLLIDDKGRKIIPEIRLEHCRSYVNGPTMMVVAWATNTGKVEVELDKVELLGVKYELDRFLKPGQAHELTLYKGPVPVNESYHEAILYYKIVENGDYFAAHFMIGYNLVSNGVYTVEELHPERVIHDV